MREGELGPRYRYVELVNNIWLTRGMSIIEAFLGIFHPLIYLYPMIPLLISFPPPYLISNQPNNPNTPLRYGILYCSQECYGEEHSDELTTASSSTVHNNEVPPSLLSNRYDPNTVSTIDITKVAGTMVCCYYIMIMYWLYLSVNSSNMDGFTM